MALISVVIGVLSGFRGRTHQVYVCERETELCRLVLGICLERGFQMLPGLSELSFGKQGQGHDTVQSRHLVA